MNQNFSWAISNEIICLSIPNDPSSGYAQCKSPIMRKHLYFDLLRPRVNASPSWVDPHCENLTTHRLRKMNSLPDSPHRTPPKQGKSWATCTIPWKDQNQDGKYTTQNHEPKQEEPCSLWWQCCTNTSGCHCHSKPIRGHSRALWGPFSYGRHDSRCGDKRLLDCHHRIGSSKRNLEWNREWIHTSRRAWRGGGLWSLPDKSWPRIIYLQRLDMHWNRIRDWTGTRIRISHINSSGISSESSSTIDSTTDWVPPRNLELEYGKPEL